MAFLDIRGKSDSGLNPIVQRAPAAPQAPSASSAYLVQAKAVVRTPVRCEPPPAPTIVAPPARPQPAAPTPKAEPRPAAPQARPKPAAATPAASVRRGEELAHLRKGVVLQARGDHAAAIEAFTKAIAADATCVEAYEGRGISREALGDAAGARADYAKSIEVEVRAGIARHLAES